jgi:hypothetical protein
MEWILIIGEVVGGSVAALWVWCRWATRSQQLKYRHELDYLTMKEYTEKPKEIVRTVNRYVETAPRRMTTREVIGYVITGTYPWEQVKPWKTLWKK